MRWFESLDGVLLTSFVALLTLLVRAFADTRYILVEDFGKFGANFVLVWTLGFTAIIGGWVWSLVRTSHNSRGGFYAILAYDIVCAALFGLISLVSFANHSLEYFLYGLHLLAGLTAAASASRYLNRNNSFTRNGHPPS